MNNFCQTKSITRKITLNGEETDVKFYALPIGVILKMKTAGKSISKFIATLMTDKTKDISVETSTVPSEERDAQGEAYVKSHVQQNEITPTMASFRHKQLNESIDGLIEGLTSPEVMDLVAEIVVRSAKDLFNPEDIAVFHENMDIGTMIPLLKGALEASAGGIEGLGKFLSPRVKENVAEAMTKVNGLVEIPGKSG